MDVYDFDPWDVEEQVEVAERTWPATLYKRALERVGDVRRISGRVWSVEGRGPLGDSYPNYEVQWLGGDRYECQCQGSTHGDTRARRGCSHLLAVIISRHSNGHVHTQDGSVGAKPGGGDTSFGDTPVGERPMQGSVQLELVVPSASALSGDGHEPSMPTKFAELRPGQWQAVSEVLDAYQGGAEVVWLDAPTGTGKTLVAELVRRMLKARAFYVCHSKSLQRQFMLDFSYGRMLMGRGNYLTTDGGPEVTCEDCTQDGPMDSCLWCADTTSCPYRVAKRQAQQARLTVLNTSYLLTEANYIGQVTAHRDLGIVDECDVLEDELLGFVQFNVSDRVLRRLRLNVPKEGSHRTTIGKWVVEVLEPRLKAEVASLVGEDLRTIRDRHRLGRLWGKTKAVCREVEADPRLAAWVRDVRAGPLVLKPVTVSRWGSEALWNHARRWLCMSATIVSADELAGSTGLERPWAVVRVPMGFPVENRRVIVAPVADMSKKGREAGEWDRAVDALGRVCERHPGDRILVHTVSYDLARQAADHLRRVLARPVFTYTRAADRDRVLADFRRTGAAVLVAPSLDRGVDLAGDECRVVVVLKVPFPNLGDRQTAERMRLPDGDAWYATQTVRTLVQMTGRAVRSADDWCVSYVLDRQMVKDSRGHGGVLKRHRALLPAWWREALVLDFPVRELLEE